jgi:riboflavin kinase/FMN adenylyltransferase
MGRNYFLRGTVTEGRGMGRTAGMPTVNFYPIGMCLPNNGVYATLSTLEDGRSFPSVTNVGLRPTMEDGRGISVETHFLDFDGDLYGKSVKVEFIGYIREEIKFSSITDLSEQVKKDIAFYKALGIEDITTFGCYLGQDYEELYGEPDIWCYTQAF